MTRSKAKSGKLKTHKGATKRFKCTGSGAYVRKSSSRRHNLSKKTMKQKRQLRGNQLVHDSDHKAVKLMLKD